MEAFQGELPTMALWIGALVAAGLFAGLLAGLLGVGGGIVIVPVLYNILAAVGVEQDLRMKVAVATSLATIIVTSFVSARSHHKKGAIDLDLLRQWSVPIVIGVVIGTAVAGYVNGRVLTLVFAVVALLVAANMLLRKEGAGLFDGFPNATVRSGAALAVGTLSTMMGIGGGTLSVPILTTFGFDIRRAVATSATIGLIIAIPGTVGYMVTGYDVAHLPPYSIGYVNVAGALVLLPMTIAMAPVGARLAHSIPRYALRLVFAFFLAATSAKMFFDLFG